METPKPRKILLNKDRVLSVAYYNRKIDTGSKMHTRAQIPLTKTNKFIESQQELGTKKTKSYLHDNSMKHDAHPSAH